MDTLENSEDPDEMPLKILIDNPVSVCELRCLTMLRNAMNRH